MCPRIRRVDVQGLVDRATCRLGSPGPLVHSHSPGPEFAAKGLELLKEAAPSISRVAVLVDSSTVHEPLSLDAQRAAATVLSQTFRQDRLRLEGLSVSGEFLNVHRPSLRPR